MDLNSTNNTTLLDDGAMNVVIYNLEKHQSVTNK